MGLFDLLRRAVPGRAAAPLPPAREHNRRAIAAIRRGDRDAAVAELVAALEADPADPAAVVTAGNLLLEDGAVDDAIVHYRRAVVLDDRYAPAYHNLGVALHRAGRRGEAVRMLRQATRLESRMRR